MGKKEDVYIVTLELYSTDMYPLPNIKDVRDWLEYTLVGKDKIISIKRKS